MEVQETAPKTLEQETAPKTLEQEQDELDKFMAQYKTEPTTVEVSKTDLPPTEQQTNVAVTQPVQTPVSQPPPTSSDPEAPYGRYQRGKNKGKPRSTPYISVKGVSSVPPPSVPNPGLPQAQPKLSGMLISAGLFLMLVNLCLPLFISMVNNFFSKDKLNPDHLKLTKEQIKELDPVCDAVMKQASVTGNPLLLLILGICTAMGMNYMMWKMKQPVNPKKDGVKPTT